MTSPTLDSREGSENARAKYAAAISLWIHEGSGVWAKFACMIYAQTALIVTIGVVLTRSKAEDAAFRYILCSLGLVLTVAWFLMTTRGFAYERHYIQSALDVEKLLGNNVGTVAGGNALQFALVERARVKWCIYAVMGVFAVLYVAAMVFPASTPCNPLPAAA